MPVRTLLAFAVCFLSACGSTSHIRQTFAPPATAKYQISDIKTTASAAEAPEHFLAAVRGHLKSALAKQGRGAADAGASHDISIDVTSYRMRTGFTRALFGILAGKDGITSNVTVRDVKTGQVVGQTEVATGNITAIGGEDDIARMHAEEIAKFVLPAVK